MATFDYALGYRLLNYNSKEAQKAGAAKEQKNEAQCATSVSAFGFWHGFKDATILGNAKDRYANAKASGYKVGKDIKPWSWICFGTGYYGKYGHIMAVYDVVGDCVYYCEANSTGDGKLSEDDMIIRKTKITNLTNRNGYQGCIYLADTFPKVKPTNLDYHYELNGNKTKLNKTVSFTNYKVNSPSGLNYREFPNGKVVGTFSNNAIVAIFDKSETKVNGLTWVKANNGYYCVKDLLVDVNVSKPSIVDKKELKSETTTLQGLDISACQTSVDFNLVKSLGYKFVILRAGYGNAIAYPNQYDTTFEKYYKAAKDVGLDVGAYWFSYAKSVDDVKKEAESFIKVLNGKQLEYPVYFDIENQFQFEKGKDFCDSLITNFCETLAKANYYPAIYCSTYWLTNFVSESVRNKYPVWIAEYASKCNYKGNYGIWQNGTVKISGTGDVDHDFCYVDYPTIIKQEGKNGFNKTPTPTPKPTYKTYYANDKNGVNYRDNPAGNIKGTYTYGQTIRIEVGSETTKEGTVWVRAKNTYWSAKNLLSTKKPAADTYKIYYANDPSGVNYRKTPNGQLVGKYNYGEVVNVKVGSETDKDGTTWVQAKNNCWSAKSLLSTTKPDVYKVYYANDPSGVNFRKTPNGAIMGYYAYGTSVKIVVDSETTKDGIVWVKAQNGYWSAKNLLSTTNPITYKVYYAYDRNGVNYRKTPNGQLVGTYKYGQAIKIRVGSETSSGGVIWVQASNGYWSARNLLSTTKPKV